MPLRAANGVSLLVRLMCVRQTRLTGVKLSMVGYAFSRASMRLKEADVTVIVALSTLSSS